MSGEIYYPQNEQERNYFNYLWDIANSRPPAAPGASDLTGELSGLAAVTFFQRSGVDKGFLKQIWSLSTPVATMNINQFYVALRFIAMIQNGEMPISKEKLLATTKEKFELPKFNGIDIPRPVAPSPVAPAAAAPASAAFAITPPEHMKYHSLFVNYDTDRDGFLSREEAIPILRQSGLDPRAVDQIWAFADDDRDNRLTSKEFSAAFHMIVCVSKRGQPLPSALPPSLKLFLVNAPAIPGEGSSGVPPPMPPTAVASTVPAHVQAPAPAPAPVEVKKQDISSAFSSFDDPVVASTASSSSNAVGNCGSVADDADIRNSLDAMKAATKKTVAAHEQAVEINGKAYSSLHGIKQRLATDRIALEATVANAIVANNECNAKLEQVSSEIQQLQEQIRQLTAKLQETSQNTSSSQSRLAKAQEEKQQLLREIDQLLRQIDHSQEDSLQLTDKLTAAERESSRLETENKALSRTSASLRSDINDLARENEDLRRIALSLRERSSAAINQKQNLDTRLTLTNDKVASQKASNQQLQKQVQIDTKQLESLKDEKKQLLQQISPGSAASITSSSPMTSAFDEISDFPSTKTVASASAITTGTFDDSDDPFGGFASENISSKSNQNSNLLPASTKVSGIASSNKELEEDPFGGFDSEKVAVEASVPSTSEKRSSASPASAVAPNTETTASDPFGDSVFNNTSTSPSDPDPFAGFTEATSSPLPTTGSTKNEDPFEQSFGSSPSSPAPTKPPKPAASAPVKSAEEDPFGEGFESSNTTSDPFGGFDNLNSSSSAKNNETVDDPFSGFDDNVPLPKTSSPLPSAKSASSQDPFAAFTEDPAAAKTDDPFGGSSTSFGDGFAAFGENNTSHKESASDPFANFDKAGASSFGDDGFGGSAFSGNDEDPFGSSPSNHQSGSQKKTEEDDPFAGFD